jgi:hypothetical protein
MLKPQTTTVKVEIKDCFQQISPVHQYLDEDDVELVDVQPLSSIGGLFSRELQSQATLEVRCPSKS